MNKKIIPFCKMHGMGNDYIYFDLLNNDFIDKSSILQNIKKLTNRNFGIGSDGIVFISKSSNTESDVKMSIFNIDGSEAEMCGNALMCVIMYIQKKVLTNKKFIFVETKNGISSGKITDLDQVTVKMFQSPRVNLNAEKIKLINNSCFNFHRAEIGNPHAVIKCDEPDNINIKHVGKEIENDLSIFPNRTNVEFYKEVNPGELYMRVWERGSGETMSCGSGAACVAATYRAANKNKYDNINVKLKTGDFNFHWKNQEFYMTGNAEYVFQGEIEI